MVMVRKQDLKRLSSFLWEVPKGWRGDMRVPGRIYADERILEMALADRSLEQLVNTTTLPGIVGHALAMPDVHQGYGFPIGGVAATALPDGVISPGGVGYDINCGVRLLTSTIEAEAIRPYMQEVMSALYAAVPTGVGASRGAHLTDRELRRVLEQGSEWALRSGQATSRDLEHTEDGGRMPQADAAAVSARAQDRGRNQLGSLGSGNHFLEVDEIVEVYDEAVAGAWGLVPGRITVWIHCGSRGLGHQVCSDAIRQMQRASSKYGITLPDRELVCAPLDSPEGRQYLTAMACAANYAWANRQVITHLVRETFERVLAGKLPPANLEVLYDVCHNIAKIEEHTVEGRTMRLCVHRKGATRAFGPGRPEVPAPWRRLGQPVLIPGDMGSGSYVLVGTERAMEETFGSTCHGAGRVMSRGQAKRAVRGQQLRSELEAEGVVVRAGSMAGLADEAPMAYKDLEQVVQVVHSAGLARRVARTRPLGVIKG
jgi:tRNA-splicing ligase RtcB